MGEGGGEVADFELLVLDSLYLNDSSTSVVLRPDYTLELPGYTEQWDGHLLGCNLGPGISQSFQAILMCSQVGTSAYLRQRRGDSS